MTGFPFLFKPSLHCARGWLCVSQTKRKTSCNTPTEWYKKGWTSDFVLKYVNKTGRYNSAFNRRAGGKCLWRLCVRIFCNKYENNVLYYTFYWVLCAHQTDGTELLSESVTTVTLWAMIWPYCCKVLFSVGWIWGTSWKDLAHEIKERNRMSVNNNQGRLCERVELLKERLSSHHRIEEVLRSFI